MPRGMRPIIGTRAIATMPKAITVSTNEKPARAAREAALLPRVAENMAIIPYRTEAIPGSEYRVLWLEITQK